MKPKHPLKSRMHWLGFATIVLAVAQLVQVYLPAILAGHFSVAVSAWIMLIVGVLIIVLRQVTNRPVSWSAPLAAPAPDGEAP
jgi:hypothetical protein